MFCQPRRQCVMPAVVHPTKQCVTNTFETVIVPHVHPTHTTNVNHVNYVNQHYFPQTFSNQQTQSVQNVTCGSNNCGCGNR